MKFRHRVTDTYYGKKGIAFVCRRRQLAMVDHQMDFKTLFRLGMAGPIPHGDDTPYGPIDLVIMLATDAVRDPRYP